jgi:hypothetical protein
MYLWNEGNDEKYTKAEHSAKNPDAYDMCSWNDENDEKYTEAEIYEKLETEQ